MPRYIALSVESHTTGVATRCSASSILFTEPVVLQNIDPGIDADQKRGPERHDDEHHGDALPGPGQSRHAIGDRIANQQQDGRRGYGDDEAAQIRHNVEVVRDQQPEIIQRQFAKCRLDRGKAFGEIEHRRVRRLRDRGLRQADLQHEAEWHQEEKHHPEVRRDRSKARRTGEDAARAHCSSTTQSSDVNQTTTRWLA